VHTHILKYGTDKQYNHVRPRLQLRHRETVCWTVAKHTQRCRCTDPAGTRCFCSHHDTSNSSIL